MRRMIRLFLPLIITAALSGIACAEGFPSDPPELEEHAVTGDMTLRSTREVTLYYVSSDGVTLTDANRSFASNERQTLCEAVVRELLTSPLNLRFRLGTPDISLIGLEEACGIVTVDLSVDAGAELDAQEKYTFLTSIADTLLGMDGIRAVNILIGGRATSTEGLPTGAFTLNSGNVAALFAQIGNESRRVGTETEAGYLRNVIMYYPASDSDLFLPQVRTIGFTASLQTNIAMILNALADAESLSPACAPISETLDNCLDTLKPVIEHTPTGERILALDCSGLSSGDPFFNTDRFKGAVTLTLLSYLDDLDGIRFIGMDSESGLCAREVYAARIGSSARLYFKNASDGDRLVGHDISMPPLASRSGLEVLRRAAAFESFDGMGSIFPEGIGPEDILGIELIEHTAVVDLSGKFYTCCQNLTEMQERLLIYGMIDMLCASDDIRAVRFSFDGQTVESLSGHLYLGTALMSDPGLIESED